MIYVDDFGPWSECNPIVEGERYEFFRLRFNSITSRRAVGAFKIELDRVFNGAFRIVEISRRESELEIREKNDLPDEARALCIAFVEEFPAAEFPVAEHGPY